MFWSMLKKILIDAEVKKLWILKKVTKWNPNGLYLLDSFGNGQMGSTNDQRNCSEEKVKKIMDSEESKRL